MAVSSLARAGAAIVVLALASALAPPPDAEEPVAFTDKEIRRILRHGPLGAPPPDPTNRVADDPRAAHLGQFLFFDPRLSSNNAVACATCHDPAVGFADARPLGKGIEEGTRHPLSLLNVAYNRWFFWDGRSDTLWAQALEPLERADEMGGSRGRTARLVWDDPRVRAAYERIFGPLPAALADRDRFPTDARPVPKKSDHPHNVAWESMTPADREIVNDMFVNVGKSIAAYERLLVRRESAFDRFARGLRAGDPAAVEAISPAAQRGLRIFIGDGNCRFCHVGSNFTDGEFHGVRVAPRAGGEPVDPGRYGGVGLLLENPFNAASRYSDDPEGPIAAKLEFVAADTEQWGLFKTPSLRNVELTPPYMHQGQMASLEDVIDHYSTFRDALPEGHHRETILQPLELDGGERADLIAFLRSLTGEPLPGKLELPPVTPEYHGDHRPPGP